MRSLNKLLTLSLLNFLALTFLALVLYSCGGEDDKKSSSNICGSQTDGADSATPNFAHVYNSVMSNTAPALNCGQCHTTGGEASTYGVTLDLCNATNAKSGLIAGTAKSSATPDCNGQKYVVAGDPDASYLLAVMGGAPSFSDCTPTNRHTVGNTAIGISASQVQLIKQWIEAGAK